MWLLLTKKKKRKKKRIPNTQNIKVPIMTSISHENVQERMLNSSTFQTASPSSPTIIMGREKRKKMKWNETKYQNALEFGNKNLCDISTYFFPFPMTPTHTTITITTNSIINEQFLFSCWTCTLSIEYTHIIWQLDDNKMGR